MDAKEILYASQLDILFDGKNKAYGAYALRKSYNKRIEVAMGATVLLVMLFVGSTMLPKVKPDLAPVVMHVDKVKLEQYKQPEKPKVIPPPPAEQAPKLAMQKLTIPKVVPDNLVKPDEMPPKQTDKIKVGPVTQTGLTMDGLLTAPPEKKGVGNYGNGTGPGSANDNTDYKQTFNSVQVEAMYPGGQAAWKKYLERNLRRQIAVDNGAAPGTYAVVVSFLVAKDGTTSEVKAISAPDPDYGTAEEAVRVIERSGKWQPAIQNGRSVIFREKQKIIFQVSE